jgi:hypothetical protein
MFRRNSVPLSSVNICFGRLLSDTVVLKRKIVRSSQNHKRSVTYGLESPKDHNLINPSLPQNLKTNILPDISCDTLDVIK